MVAEALGVPIQGIEVSVEGDLDLSGTLGVSKDALVGFEDIRVTYAVDAPDAQPEQIERLKEKSEQYCVVYQTLVTQPKITTRWESG